MALVSTNSFYLQTLQTHILRFSSLYGHMSTTTDKTLKINHLNMFLLSINPHRLRNILISPVPGDFFFTVTVMEQSTIIAYGVGASMMVDYTELVLTARLLSMSF